MVTEVTDQTSGADGQRSASGVGSRISELVLTCSMTLQAGGIHFVIVQGLPDWGGCDYELLEHVGQSQLLLDRDLQEHDVSSPREHNVRAQDPAWRDRCFLASPYD